MIIIQKYLDVYGNITKMSQMITDLNALADGNTKDAEIIVPLIYLSNFWRTLEMSLINCEIYLI